MKKSFIFFGMNFKYLIIFILLLIASGIIPIYLIINYNYNEKDLLSFYGAYLTFVGTFALGYVTYIKDEKRRKEVAYDKSRLLLNTLRYSQAYFFTKYTEYTKIEYDKKWHEYYYEFEFYIGLHDSELENELNLYFKTLDRISECISQKHIKDAEIIANNYVEAQKYEVGKYNFFDATETILLDLLGSSHPQKPWFKKRAIRKIISKYKKQYFSIIENWVYAYILKSDLDYVKIDDYLFELCDWLLEQKMFQGLYSSIYERRIVCRIAYETILTFSNKSKKLDYCWRETSLRVKDS